MTEVTKNVLYCRLLFTVAAIRERSMLVKARCRLWKRLRPTRKQSLASKFSLGFHRGLPTLNNQKISLYQPLASWTTNVISNLFYFKDVVEREMHFVIDKHLPICTYAVKMISSAVVVPSAAAAAVSLSCQFTSRRLCGDYYPINETLT